MKIISGNLLEQKGVLLHQVNLRGIMGAGIALQIRKRWPSAHDDYVRHCRKCPLVTDVVFSEIDNGFVAHLFGQSDISRAKCTTCYEAYPEMLTKVRTFSRKLNLPIFAPYGIGCGLAGGEWSIMEPIFEEHLTEVTLVKYEEIK